MMASLSLPHPAVGKVEPTPSSARGRRAQFGTSRYREVERVSLYYARFGESSGPGEEFRQLIARARRQTDFMIVQKSGCGKFVSAVPITARRSPIQMLVQSPNRPSPQEAKARQPEGSAITQSDLQRPSCPSQGQSSEAFRTPKKERTEIVVPVSIGSERGSHASHVWSNHGRSLPETPLSSTL